MGETAEKLSVVREFLLALGFWQWIGVLCLAGIVFGSVAAAIAAVVELFKPRSK